MLTSNLLVLGVSGEIGEYNYTSLLTLIEVYDDLTSFPIGPSNVTCTSDADCRFVVFFPSNYIPRFSLEH